MPHKWRFLDTETSNAPYNMALEKVLLMSHADGIALNTLHFLEFTPCVLLGYNQSVSDEIDEDYCQNNGIEVNRRISGGGCIYMDGGALGWELIAKKNTPGIPANLEEMYRKLCGGVIAALSHYHINARYRPLNDVEVDGRKISGAGGAEIDDSIIFHGTVLIDFDAETMVKALKLPLNKMEDKQIRDFKMRTICMRELLGCVPPTSDVKARLAQAFAEILDIEFEKDGLYREEIETLNAELPTFESYEWIYGRRSPSAKNGYRTCEYKATGGLIRVSLICDDAKRLIKSAFITGDFFAYPQRGVLALENALKNTPYNPDAVTKKIYSCFESNELKIPGATADDFIKAVIGATQCGAARRGAAKRSEIGISYP